MKGNRGTASEILEEGGVTVHALDRWERRLEDLFTERLYDMLDATLYDTINKFLTHTQGQTTESSTSTSGPQCDL